MILGMTLCAMEKTRSLKAVSGVMETLVMTHSFFRCRDPSTENHPRRRALLVGQ
jgi:type IV secretory pathway TraG/TraD family ATPase VirD4